MWVFACTLSIGMGRKHGLNRIPQFRLNQLRVITVILDAVINNDGRKHS